MESRSISTQNILQKLEQPKIYSDHLPIQQSDMSQKNSPMQQELNRIADQATNLGFGSGVALRKALEHMKKQLPDLRKHCAQLRSHFVGKQVSDTWSALFFSDSPLASVVAGTISSAAESYIVQQCDRYANQIQEVSECLEGVLEGRGVSPPS